MHPLDRDEFLANLGELGRQAKGLLADPALVAHCGTLHRIVALLAYMREHLEMVNPSAEKRATGEFARTTEPAASPSQSLLSTALEQSSANDCLTEGEVPALGGGKAESRIS